MFSSPFVLLWEHIRFDSLFNKDLTTATEEKIATASSWTPSPFIESPIHKNLKDPIPILGSSVNDKQFVPTKVACIYSEEWCRVISYAVLLAPQQVWPGAAGCPRPILDVVMHLH